MDPKSMLAGIVLFFSSIVGHPAGYNYNYIKQINSDKLQQEIVTSTITSKLKEIKTIDDVVKIYFKKELSGAEETTLDTIVANHTIDVTYPNIGIVKRISDLESENAQREFEIAGSLALISGLQENISSLGSNMANVTVGLSNTQADVAGVNTILADVNTDILFLKQEDADIKTSITVVDTKVDSLPIDANLRADLDALADTVTNLPVDANLRADLDALTGVVNDLPAVDPTLRTDLDGLQITVNNLLNVPKEYAVIEVAIGTSALTSNATTPVYMDDMQIALMVQSTATVDVTFTANLTNSCEPINIGTSTIIYIAPVATVELVRYSAMEELPEGSGHWILSDETIMTSAKVPLNKALNIPVTLLHNERLNLGVWSYAVRWYTKSHTLMSGGTRMLKVRVQKLTQ